VFLSAAAERKPLSAAREMLQVRDGLKMYADTGKEGATVEPSPLPAVLPFCELFGRHVVASSG